MLFRRKAVSGTKTNDRNNLSYQIMADDPRLRTRTGSREPKTISVLASEGCALHGPYIDLRPGRYRAIILFNPSASCQGRALMDVCADGGKQRLARRWIAADEIVAGGMRASLDFSCPEPAQAIEVRLFVKGKFAAGIDSVVINGETTEAASEARRLTISDLPIPTVENSVRKGRNLYEGYQRGTGLAFHNLGQRITTDPDFYYARALAGSRTSVGYLTLANIFLLIKLFVPRLPFGHIVVFGSDRGGSAIFMAALAQKFLPGAHVIGCDAAGGMPAADLNVDARRGGGADVNLIELNQYVGAIGLDNLSFVQDGSAEAAAPTLQRHGSVALCHIDCDTRAAVEYAYDVTKSHMVPGGYWVFDGPFAADCIGTAEAVEDILIKGDGLNSEQLYPHYVFRQPFEQRSSNQT